MSIVTWGFGGTYIITLGYGGPSGPAITGGDGARYYYMKPQIQPKNRKELLLSIKKLLEALKGA